jgi:Acyl-CoA dehydrogenase, middle domain/Acyl-CoA dehydrogenase, N-terminal domain
VQLTFDADVEAFRADFVAFLDEHLPSEADALERSRSSSHIPEWARNWQRLIFDTGWLLPGYPPEFGGRNATLLQQYVNQQELARRRAYLTFNPQGVGIISASLISFGTPEQQRRWAVPILRAEMTASLGMSEPGAGSDLASLRTRAVRDGDDFVVNGQKVWTSGAHDADVLLTFVRTDPNASKHKGISALMIPTELPGVIRRPFASACDQDDLDFNEVFFSDVRVPAENLVGPPNEGWRVANRSLGHERNMLWLSYADRLQELVEDFRPRTVVDRDRYATLVMDNHALRLLGDGVGPRGSRRRGCGRLVGAQTVRVGGLPDGDRARAGRSSCRRPAPPELLRALQRASPRPLPRRLVRTLRPHVRRHHRRWHFRNPTQHHCPASAGPAPKLRNNHVHRL